jgi:hypothetical protein
MIGQHKDIAHALYHLTMEGKVTIELGEQWKVSFEEYRQAESCLTTCKTGPILSELLLALWEDVYNSWKNRMFMP